jgi:putative DNA methylase
LDAITRADAQREQCGFDPSDFTAASGPKSKSLLTREIDNYLDLFSSRQLLYLRAAITGLAGMEPLVRLNLALLVSTSLEFNTMLCGYKGDKKRRPGAIRHAFAYHAYSFPYTALENNPVYPARKSGTLQNLFNGRIVRGRTWAKNPIEREVVDGRSRKVTITGEVDAGIEQNDFADLHSGSRRFLLIQGSSATLDLPDDSVDAIVTDPPYFDSVQYSDLAAFFRVWLQQLLPDDAVWQYALDGSAVEATTDGSGEGYTAVLSGIFRECRRVLKGDGRFIFTYHHWNPKGWAALTIALRRAGFVLVNRYVVHAENLASRHIVGQNALQHDVILVLAANQKAGGQWDEITSITLTDSAQFCYDCGNALGWFLHTNTSETEVEANWHRLLNQN